MLSTRADCLAALQALFATVPPHVSDPLASRPPALVGLESAAARARAGGLVVLSLGMQQAGEARDLASVLAAIALQGVRTGRATAPTVILSAGPVKAGGRRIGAAAFLLTLALALDAHPAIYAYACAGPSDAEADPAWHGFVAPDTLLRARAQGLSPERSLVDGRAQSFFEALGDRVALDAPATGLESGLTPGHTPALSSGLPTDPLLPDAVVLRALLLV